MSIVADIIKVNTSVAGTQIYGDVQIVLRDATTGLPTNGNGAIVDYDSNLNGTVSSATVQIFGQSIYVYNNILLADSNSSSSYFTKFQIASVIEEPSTPPPIPAGVCDLSIINITTTPETSVGSANGTATINATSSNGPIQYSLDNITWQDSNIFTGLINGVKTAYVKDSLSCTDQKSFTIVLTANVLVSDPSVTLATGVISRWNAAFNNIYFTFQRKDFEVTSVVADPLGTGNILVNINADVSTVTPSGSVTINGITTTYPGSYVYINTALYKGVYQTLRVATGGLVLACTWTANDTTGFVNINQLRPGYTIQCLVNYVDPLSNSLQTITLTFQPLPNGYLQADFQYFLRSLLNPVSLSNYTAINYRDLQLSASYMVSYAEVWNGNTPVWTALPNPYYVTYAAMQLQDVGGGNLQQYVTYLNNFQPAKWLTDFGMPVYSEGFPFDISFISSEYLAGLSPFYVITLLDINMKPLTNQTVNNGYLLNENGTYILNQDGSKFIIASQSVESDIVQYVGLNRLLINFTVPTECWYFNVQLFYTQSSQTYPLTVAQTVQIDERYCESPCYLRWIGLHGAWEYYRFAYNQDYGLETSDLIQGKNYVTDWAGGESIETVIQKTAVEKITVYAVDVSLNDLKGCRGIKTSPVVQLYLPDTQKWQTVIVAAGSYVEYSSMEGMGDLQISFNLPSMNLQSR